MSDKKVFAFMVAFVMFAAGGITIIGAGSTDADYVTNGEFSVKVVDSVSQNGINIDTTTIAYNGAIALVNVLGNYNYDIDMDTYYYPIDYYLQDGTPVYSDYPTINKDYGVIYSINGVEDDDTYSWHVYYQKNTGVWDEAADALGFYKPFGDYDSDHQTANIAVYYGTDSNASSYRASLSQTQIKTIVPTSAINGNPYFAVSFTIGIVGSASTYAPYWASYQMALDVVGNLDFDESSIDNATITITGYGSDLYLALKNVITEYNIVALEEVPGHQYPYYFSDYSWMDVMFGVGTVFITDNNNNDWTDDIYAWWQQFTTYEGPNDPDNVKSDFVLGYYSPVNGAPNTLTSYSLIYMEGTM